MFAQLSTRPHRPPKKGAARKMETCSKAETAIMPNAHPGTLNTKGNWCMNA